MTFTVVINCVTANKYIFTFPQYCNNLKGRLNLVFCYNLAEKDEILEICTQNAGV